MAVFVSRNELLDRLLVRGMQVGMQRRYLRGQGERVALWRDHNPKYLLEALFDT